MMCLCNLFIDSCWAFSWICKLSIDEDFDMREIENWRGDYAYGDYGRLKILSFLSSLSNSLLAYVSLLNY